MGPGQVDVRQRWGCGPGLGTTQVIVPYGVFTPEGRFDTGVRRVVGKGESLKGSEGTGTDGHKKSRTENLSLRKQ